MPNGSNISARRVLKLRRRSPAAPFNARTLKC
jgi:hypothetical protein